MMFSGRILQKRSFVGILMAAMNGAGSLLIIAVTLLICADIAGRSLFGRPVAGVAELVALSIVAVVFLQLGQAVRSDALARTNVVLLAIQRRSMRGGALLQGVYAVVAALLFTALLYGSWYKLADAWSSNEHVGVYGQFVAPVWPVSAVVVVGSGAAVLQFLIHAHQSFARAFTAKVESAGGK